jgi:hypothetical protein
MFRTFYVANGFICNWSGTGGSRRLYSAAGAKRNYDANRFGNSANSDRLSPLAVVYPKTWPMVGSME